MMNKLFSKRIFFVAIFAILVVLILGVSRQHASALSFELPDRDTISNPDGSYPNNGGVMLEISQPGPNIFLNVNDSWAKVYYPSSSTNLGVQIYDGDFGGCGTKTTDTQGDNGSCNGDPGAVNYEFYYGDNTNGGTSPAPGAPFQTINSSFFEPPTNNGDSNYVTIPSFPLPGGGPINTGAGSNYIIYVRAVWATGGAGSDRINGFKVAGATFGAQTSYWGYSNTSPGQPAGAGYAVQDRSFDDDTEEDMGFRFASPCSETGSPTVFLKWTDADAYGATNTGVPPDGNQFPGDQEINFELQEANIGATSGGVILSVNPGNSNSNAIGGNGDYREVSFTARPDKVYIWKWKGVNRLNGVQMWVPYDSFNFGKSCPPPQNIPKGVIDNSDCNFISGWAYDPDSSGTAIGIHIHVDGAAPGGDFYNYGAGATDVARPDVNSAFGISGTHGFSWNVPAKYKDGATHHYYLYARGVDSSGNGGGSDGDPDNPQITAFSSTPNNGGIFTCPAPPAPTVSTTCQADGSTTFTVNWNKANNPSGTTDYYVDVNNANTFPAAGGYWNRGPITPFPSTTSTSGPSGFNKWPAGSPGMPALVAGTNYYARVYYGGVGVASSVSTPFTAACPPPLITCTNLSPADTEPGAPAFNLSVTFTNAPFHAPLDSTSVVININGANSPGSGYSPYPLPGGSSATVGWNPYTPPASPGMYTVKLTFSGGTNSPGPVTCPIPSKQLVVANRPYFRAFGGDVISGVKQPIVPLPGPGPDITSCKGWSVVPGTTIDAYNTGAGVGAGGQLAAMALGTIDGFSSGTGQTYTPAPAGPSSFSGASTTRLPRYLTLANTIGTYGGNSGIGLGIPPCPYDYFKDAASATAASPPLLGLNGLDLNSLGNGNYIFDTGLLGLGSGLKIKGANLNAGTKITIYVNGNVTLCGDITYNGGSWSVGNIPSLYIIAKGNVYVQAPGTSCGLLGLGGGNGVNQLDGVYIAQPDTTSAATVANTGKFYSCSDITLFPLPPAPNFINSKCTSNLTVNGVIMAQHLRLFRVNGTRFQGAANEDSNSTGNTAEIFNAGPETWLTIPAPFTTSPIDGYDAFTGLPPVL